MSKSSLFPINPSKNRTRAASPGNAAPQNILHASDDRGNRIAHVDGEAGLALTGGKLSLPRFRDTPTQR